MEKEVVLTAITDIIRKISSIPTLKIEESTQFSEIEDWDSLNTVDMEMELESMFNISFATGEFRELETVGELLTCIMNK